MRDRGRNEILERMKAQEQKKKALAWLDGLAKTSRLGRYLRNCIVCGKDSEGIIRCKRHYGDYEKVFFKNTEEFLKIFAGQM